MGAVNTHSDPSRIESGIWNFGSAISELIYPALCVVCERRYASGTYSVCPFCWGGTLKDRRRTNSADESSQTSDYAKLDSVIKSAEADSFEPLRIARTILTISLGEYRSPLSDMLQKFKYEGFIALGKRLTLALARLRRLQIEGLQAEALVPVPLHITGLKWRGFNQARVISDILSEVSGLPVAENVVKKIVKTKNQANLSVEDRRHNLAGAFIATESRYAGRKVIVVDDVITTGATIAEVGLTIEQAGVEVVGAIALASAVDSCEFYL